MDVPVTTPFMPRANKTIAKKSFLIFPYSAGFTVSAACWLTGKMMQAVAKVMKT